MADAATAAPGIGIPALMKSVACGKRLNQTACLPGPPCLLCLRSGNRTAPARVLITVSDPGPFTPRPNAGVVFAAYGWFSRPGLFAPTGFLFRFEIQKIRCKT